MKALHRSGGSTAAALDHTVDYSENSEKTNDGEFIDAYECDPFTTQSEFLFSKRQYEQKTGRDQGNRGVIAYHIIFNSVNLNCGGKYNDFKRSAITLRRVSDQIRLENRLSVIEKLGLSKGYNRAEYLGGGKAPWTL